MSLSYKIETKYFKEDGLPLLIDWKGKFPSGVDKFLVHDFDGTEWTLFRTDSFHNSAGRTSNCYYRRNR